MKLFPFLCLFLLWAYPLTAKGGTETSLDVHWFGQTGRWEDRKLGDSKVITIGTHGCALTAAAMVLHFYGVNTDPVKLNRWLLKNNGYEEGWDDQTGNSLGHVRIIWNIPVTGFVEIKDFIRYDYKSGPADLGLIRSTLDSGIPVIAEVLRPGGIQHFVVLTGYRGDDFTMRDPLDETWTLLSEKYNIADEHGSGAARNIFGIRIYIPREKL